MDKSRSCNYMGKRFKNGQAVCKPDRCIMCRDGVWNEEPVS
jgi:hypothetical protein